MESRVNSLCQKDSMGKGHCSGSGSILPYLGLLSVIGGRLVEPG